MRYNQIRFSEGEVDFELYCARNKAIGQLKEYQGYTWNEIGEKFGLSKGHIKEIGHKVGVYGDSGFAGFKEGDRIGDFCPWCAEGLLLVRQNKKTKDYFLGCSAYPDCKYTHRLRLIS